MLFAKCCLPNAVCQMLFAKCCLPNAVRQKKSSDVVHVKQSGEDFDNWDQIHQHFTSSVFHSFSLIAVLFFISCKKEIGKKLIVKCW